MVPANTRSIQKEGCCHDQNLTFKLPGLPSCCPLKSAMPLPDLPRRVPTPYPRSHTTTADLLASKRPQDNTHECSAPLGAAVSPALGCADEGHASEGVQFLYVLQQPLVDVGLLLLHRSPQGVLRRTLPRHRHLHLQDWALGLASDTW